jgi:PadR family transcriptional regulator PadR
MRQFEANWSTQLRKGIYELCLLNALKDRRRYGYEIVQALRAIDSLVVSEGAIYPILNRLKTEELVTTYLEESPGGPPRKYYELTKKGRKQLDSMNRYWVELLQGVENLRKELSS